MNKTATTSKSANKHQTNNPSFQESAPPDLSQSLKTSQGLKTAKKILVTAALPYANGEVHLGHLLEHLQVDVWTRAQKMMGNDCIFVCADDTHGTPIMIRAREEGITAEELIQRAHKEHENDFRDFLINHDIYHSTNSVENKELCEEFYHSMKTHGHIDVRAIKQLFCEHDKMFLPDRFVKGTCPKCGATDQYGDSCDKCGATYSPQDLKDPKCYLCGTSPVTKASDHYFFKLNNFKTFLESWLPEHTQDEVAAKMMEWFKEDLRDWDISRDEPYFGFPIPGASGKYFYVWVDAPMGYVSSTKKWCALHKKNFDDYWKSEDSEVYHFIGKDITYFHTLFWPALLQSAGFRTPSAVYAHGFISVNGEKMSKSKGTFISIRTYLNHLDPEYLRYYLSSKLNSKVEDLDFNTDDFAQRVNSDLVGKITNLGSRGAQMLGKNFQGKMSEPDNEGLKLITMAQNMREDIEKNYSAREYSKLISEVRHLADLTNKYFDEKTPWKTVETNPQDTQKVLTTTLIIFRIIAIYLAPILPKYVVKVRELFNEDISDSVDPLLFSEVLKDLGNIQIKNYEHLMSRIDPEKIKSMKVEALEIGKKTLERRSKIQTSSGTTPKVGNMTKVNEESSALINIDDFMKVDLRVAKIIEAEVIPDADKLLKLKVDLGTETRQIIAGIRSAYTPENLIGRLTVIVANLAPRKMKFGISEGMVLAAGDGGKDLYILNPDMGAKPGQKIK